MSSVSLTFCICLFVEKIVSAFDSGTECKFLSFQICRLFYKDTGDAASWQPHIVS